MGLHARDKTYAALSVGKRAPMRVALLLLLAFPAGLAACAQTAHESVPLNASTLANPVQDRQAVIDRIVAATVKITREENGQRLNTGSGVVIASRPAARGEEAATYVLTAAHVLVAVAKDASAPLYVRFGGPHATLGRFAASVVRQGDPTTLDVGLLRVNGVAIPPVHLVADGSVKLGEAILVVGFPWGHRLGLFGGIVSQIPVADGAAPDEAIDQTLVVDAATCKGVSGGGVFRQNSGTLIGLVEGYQTTSIALKSQTQTYSVKVPVPGETYVIPIGQIRKFLADAALDDLPSFIDASTSW